MELNRVLSLNRCVSAIAYLIQSSAEFFECFAWFMHFPVAITQISLFLPHGVFYVSLFCHLLSVKFAEYG